MSNYIFELSEKVSRRHVRYQKRLWHYPWQETCIPPKTWTKDRRPALGRRSSLWWSERTGARRVFANELALGGFVVLA